MTGWYYNPNLHPPEEMRRRQQALTQASLALGMALLACDREPEPAEFLLALARRGGRRCHACYELRLEATARKAREEGFDAFSTTLLISPHQDLEAVHKIGAAAAEKHGVAFRFVDLRDRYRESGERARSMELYRQNYCGCMFSDLERSEARASRAIRKAARLAPVG